MCVCMEGGVCEARSDGLYVTKTIIIMKACVLRHCRPTREALLQTEIIYVLGLSV